MVPISQALLWLIGIITSVSFFGSFGHTNMTPIGNHLGICIIFIPVAGGLIVGIMARYGSSAIRGHGIPEAMEQVLENASRIPARLTWLKPLSAAISIGTGGPFGAEGPIIATGGAAGSLIGQILPNTARDRKILLAAGAAAGMTATFGSPLSSLLLALELLLFEFTAYSIIPVVMSVSFASIVRTSWVGTTPVFSISEHLSTPSIPAFLALLSIAALMGILACLISRVVYIIEDMFERLPIHWMWYPAIGALMVGIIGYFEPKTLGVGYDNITTNLAGSLPIVAVFTICTLKFISWSVALGSGTSGGTLAPLMTLGSGWGLIAGVLLQSIVPDLNPLLAALVGMACIFGAASHAMLASAVFAYETTGQSEAIFTLLACTAFSLLVARTLSRTSIMTEKIERRGISVPDQYTVDVFKHTLVGSVMEKKVITVFASLLLADFVKQLANNQSPWNSRQAFPVTDDDSNLVGIITRGDLVRFSESVTKSTTVADIAMKPVIVVTPLSTLHEAIQKMLHSDIGRLPVVDPNDSARLVGYLSRASILSARWKVLNEDTRE